MTVDQRGPDPCHTKNAEQYLPVINEYGHMVNLTDFQSHIPILLTCL